MNLAVICGNASNKVKEQLSARMDNVKIDTFRDIGDLQSNLAKRQFLYDRILISSSVVRGDKASILLELNNFLRDYLPKANVVLLCNKNQNDDIATVFAKVLNSPLYVAVILDSVTAKTLERVVSLTMDGIKAEYEVASCDSVSVIEESYDLPKPDVVQKVDKKPSFLSKIFGGKKETKVGEKQVKSNPLKDKLKFGKNKSSNQNEDTDTAFEDYNSEVLEPSMQSDEIVDEHEIVISPNLEADAEIQEINLGEPILVGSNESDITFSQEDIELESVSEVVLDGRQGKDVLDDKDTVVNLDLPLDEEAYTNSDLPIDMGTPIIGSTEPKVESVDNDKDEPIVIDSKNQLYDVDDTDIVDIGNLEREYQEQATKVKVIEKIVEKKVIVGKGSAVVNNILDGKLQKILLVTGDRGSGVTTTAIEIAKHFAKKVPVLFVDGDLKNHGVLNYLEYDTIKRFDDSHLRGTQLCKSAKAFDQCVLRYDENLDLLLSNYGVEVTDDQFITTQSVVTEVSSRYALVVVDIPFEFLHLCEDLIFTGIPTICMEANKHGIMNTLSFLESDHSKLNRRYKRAISSKGSFVLTKMHPNLNFKGLLGFAKDIVEVSDIDWLEMNMVAREKSVTDKLLDEILEG